MLVTIGTKRVNTSVCILCVYQCGVPKDHQDLNLVRKTSL